MSPCRIHSQVFFSDLAGRRVLSIGSVESALVESTTALSNNRKDSNKDLQCWATEKTRKMLEEQSPLPYIVMIFLSKIFVTITSLRMTSHLL